MFILMKSSTVAGLAGAVAASMLMAGCAAMADQPNQSMQNSSSSMQQSSMDTETTTARNRFGGPVYTGKPALAVTVALVKAGGGPNDFSLVTALNHMLGKQTVKAEVGKLTEQYGADRVNAWVDAINFYVNDTLKIVQAKGIQLPPPADLSGAELAKTLVKAGTAPDGTFWAGYLFDHAVSHEIHNQLMIDAESEYDAGWDGNAHAITNQTFYDVAQALGMESVQLASYHS